MPAYWTGLIEGFQAKREAEFLKNYQREQQNRQLADRVYSYLLASRDPPLQELALSGLSAPIGKKKGLAGFLGGVETSSVMAQIVARMNEMVPDEGLGGGPAPPVPGSAGMSTNQPVRPGSAPIQLPGQPLPPEPPPPGVGSEAPPLTSTAGQPPLGPTPGGPSPLGMPPPTPPPESVKWKRRGTGVPDAFEIMAAQSRIPLQTRLQIAREEFARTGMTPSEQAEAMEEVTRSVMGAPQSARQFQPGTGMAVQLPNGNTAPLSFDFRSGQWFLPDGKTPYDPNTMKLVRFSGTGGSVPRTAREPDPQFDTGWARVFYDTATGQELYRVQDVPFIPPAEGVAVGLDQGGNAVLQTVPRVGGGGGGRVLANAPNPQPQVGNTDAQALLAVVNQRIQALQRPPGVGRPVRVLTPLEIDQEVVKAARAANLPYQTYYELQQATRVAPARQVAPQPNAPPAPGPAVAPPASAADRIRQRALEIQAGGGGRGGPAAPPSRPPARSRGAGPRGQ